MTLAGISIRRPVATTMVMVSIIFIGLLAMFNMKKEMLPNMQVPVVTVSTAWTGAVAEDVENQITKKIEEALPNVEGIDTISSTSSYGRSTIVVKFNFGVNSNEKVNEIQREVSKIANSLPNDSNSPIVKKIEVGSGNLTAIVAFTAPNKSTLASFIDQYLKPQLESLEGVGEVSIFGNPTKQVQIQVDSDKLMAYNMTPMELYSLISASTPTIPVGKLSDGTKDMILRFMGEMRTIDDFKNMVINANGNTLRLRDVADVVLTHEDKSTIGYLNGEDSITVMISKSSDGSTVELNNSVFKTIEKLEAMMPVGTQKKIVLDTSIDINNSISNVTSSAIQGLILASIVLFIFLKSFKSTLLISASLPVAVIFTFAFLSMAGTTLNLISLMGLSIGVGMLTDNSVVVVDNIFRHLTELNSPTLEAAENGTNEVTLSIIASSLTTMVVFIPILFIPGISREIFRDMSFAIIFSNIAALIVAITLIPMLASKFLTSNSISTKEGRIFGKVKKRYLSIISWAVINRLKTVAIAIGIFLFTLLVGPRFIKFQFFPKQDTGQFSIMAELQKGTDIEKANRIAKEMENLVAKHESVESYSTIVQPNSVSLNIDIGKKNNRKKSVFEIMDEIRPLTKNILDTKISLTNSFKSGNATRDIEFIIEGSNLDEIKTLGKQVLENMQKYNGIMELTSTLSSGSTELRIEVDREKVKSYGINPATIAQTLSYYILGGDRARTVTIKSGTEEIDVLIRLPKEKRNNLAALEQINIKVADKKFIKLSDVATIKNAEASSEIKKKNRIYSVTISGNDAGAGQRVIQQKFIEEFKKAKPANTVTYSWGGDTENMIKAMGQLTFALGISIFLIYALLASQFESFIMPIIVIGSIPLALIGVIWGLVIFGQSLDIMVMIGVILLAGIVVNNAIVLIDFIKMLRERGYKRKEAIIESCTTRLRPILMTTATTVLGMIPLALGIGEGSEIYRGMALTVIFGLSFSALLTLIVIPILYALADDLTVKLNSYFSNFLKKFSKKKGAI
ncbi:MAG: efflux RND transporter permease subunit [Fusobacterium sp.]|uniref:efflux RND transporter permease subunit n=1 Tax=Fusobacterium sp. TaxID=68766 RepID=UPI0026DB8B8C|nr:efflux RND transporter permease subunit [Fusobacterium sp.]MDO4689982.1 efflux RND transporter permease subunit [Fusobacterium sp.]